MKVCYLSFDEKTKKEKKTPFNMLINAENPVQAYHLLVERLGTVDDYQITDINITTIAEIIPYEKPEQKILNSGNFKPRSELREDQSALGNTL
jgi:ribosomal protein L20A (L18A)